MTKFCDGAAGRLPCPHPEDCTISCEFNDAVQREATDLWTDLSYRLAFAMWAFSGSLVAIVVGALCVLLGVA